MRLSLASTALLLLAGAAPMASAQDAVTAWQVRAACLNPHAARWVGNVNPKLQYLCSSLDVPILGRRLKAPEMAPWLAAAADPGKVPSPGQVAAYALSAVAAADTMARQIAAAQSSSPRALSGGTFASELDGPGNGILFDPSSASLRSADSIGVRRMAETIRAHLEASAHDTVTIFGHADGTGDPVVNLVLAQRRAAALLEALMHADPSLDVKRIQARAVVAPPALTDAQYVDSLRRMALHKIAISGSNPGNTANAVDKQVDRRVSVQTSGSSLPTPQSTPPSPAEVAQTPTKKATLDLRTALAVAVADVVIETATAQVQAMLVADVTKSACDSYRAYLTATCTMFSQDLQSIYRAGPQSLREAVRKDFTALPAFVLDSALQGATNATRIAPEEVAEGRLLVRFLSRVLHGEDPIASLSAVTDWASAYPALRATSVGRSLRQTVDFLEIYLRADREFGVATHTDGVQEADAVLNSMRALLVNHQADTSGMLGLLREGETVVALAHRIAASPTEPSTDKLTRVERLRGTVADVTDLMFSVAEASTTAAMQDRLRDVATPVRDMMLAAAIGEYREATSQLLTVTQRLTNARAFMMARGLACFADTVTAKSFAAPENSLAITLNSPKCAAGDSTVITLMQPLPAETVRFLSFAVDFTDAKDQSEATHALQRFVGQGGGFLAKHEGRRWRTYVNAYLGASGGGEWANKGGLVGQTGLYLPVGVELSRGWRTASAGLFLQAFDLGAIASTRISGGSAENQSTNLAQLVAPGALFVWAPWKKPLSIGVGPSLAPLSRISDGRKYGAVRLNFFLAADVPLFP